MVTLESYKIFENGVLLKTVKNYSNAYDGYNGIDIIRLMNGEAVDGIRIIHEVKNGHIDLFYKGEKIGEAHDMTSISSVVYDYAYKMKLNVTHRQSYTIGGELAKTIDQANSEYRNDVIGFTAEFVSHDLSGHQPMNSIKLTKEQLMTVDKILSPTALVSLMDKNGADKVVITSLIDLPMDKVKLVKTPICGTACVYLGTLYLLAPEFEFGGVKL